MKSQQSSSQPYLTASVVQLGDGNSYIKLDVSANNVDSNEKEWSGLQFNYYIDPPETHIIYDNYVPDEQQYENKSGLIFRKSETDEVGPITASVSTKTHTFVTQPNSISVNMKTIVLSVEGTSVRETLPTFNNVNITKSIEFEFFSLFL